MHKPAGKGERCILLHAVTKEGGVNNAQLVFQAQRRTGDSHGAMDEENFSQWFRTQRRPNLPDNAVILMENAPYHNMLLEDRVPPFSSKKVMLQQGVPETNLPYDEQFIRAQLID